MRRIFFIVLLFFCTVVSTARGVGAYAREACGAERSVSGGPIPEGYVSGSSSEVGVTFDFEGVEALLGWFDDGMPLEEVDEIADLPAHWLAQRLLHRNDPDVETTFAEAMRAFATGGDSLAAADYLLPAAFERRQEIRELMGALRESHDAEERVAEVFPEVDLNFKTYFTAVGWQWGDAMSTSLDGVPVQVFNLTIIDRSYGRSLEEKADAFDNVLAHELFHSAVGERFDEPSTVEQTALWLVWNEGMAHWVADADTVRSMDGETLTRLRKSTFEGLARVGEVVFDTRRSRDDRLQTLLGATVGSYWSKSVAMAGLFMALDIEAALGRERLLECARRGPEYFVLTYTLL